MDLMERLEKFGIIILPDEIDHGAFEMIVDASSWFINKAIENQSGIAKKIAVYCRGDGGDSRSALAIATILHVSPFFRTILVGEANSSHAIIWAACRDRYAYPDSSLGLHMTSWNGASSRLDAQSAMLIATQFDQTDREFCRILTQASNKGYDWWMNRIKVSSGGLIKVHYEELVALGMITDFSKSSNDQAQVDSSP